MQRFGSALNLHVHFHMLFLDGVYLTSGAASPVLLAVAAPGANELQALIERIAARVGQALERRGLIERCVRCAGKPKIIASIEEPEVIAKILSHLQRTAPQQHPTELPFGARAPPLQFRLL